MIERITALTGRPAPAVGAGVIDEQPSHLSRDTANPVMQPMGPSTAFPELDPLQDTLTPEGWDHDLSLDDLWSMMDWNVGFPSMEPTSTTLPGL